MLYNLSRGSKEVFVMTQDQLIEELLHDLIARKEASITFKGLPISLNVVGDQKQLYIILDYGYTCTISKEVKIKNILTH